MKDLRSLLIVAGLVTGLPLVTTGQQPPSFDTRIPGAPVPPAAPSPIHPAARGVITPPATGRMTPGNGALPAGTLAFDGETKEYITKPGEFLASFVFNLTNISAAEITINHVQTSCGCTTAKLPPMPWKIAAGGAGQIPVNMDVRGKSGVVLKTVTLHTDKGLKQLMVKATIQQMDPNLMTPADRERNQLLAKADPQAIFKGDCARCHVEPVIGKVGKDLYTTACGICHDAEHRATMVPDLRNLPNDTSADYWRLMVTLGKPNTLMAAFAQSHGGPLSEMQINSLVEYLVATMPAKGTNSRPATVPAKASHAAAGH